MPLILKKEVDVKGDASTITNEVHSRYYSFKNNVLCYNEVPLVFLKCCGFFEQLVDEILTYIGLPDLENKTVAQKMSVLNSLVLYKPLRDSLSMYGAIRKMRNDTAHKPDYKVEEDISFLKIVYGKNAKIKKLTPEVLVRFFFDHMYMPIMFIAVGLKLGSDTKPFFTFTLEKKIPEDN